MPENTTRYIVLRKLEAHDESENVTTEVWAEIGRLDASSRDAARRAFMENDATLPEGVHSLRAVPESNWGDPQSFRVRTKRTVEPVKTDPEPAQTTMEKEAAGATA